MDHYMDIDVRPDPEFAPHQLMSVLFAKLHRALVAHMTLGVAVSFPQHDDGVPRLGNRLRLHGSLASLNSLSASGWLTDMRDHVIATGPAAVPANVKHRVVRRVQVQSSPARLRRRLMKRHELDAEEARQRIPDTAAESVHLPFIQLRSTSTRQSFRLFIAHGALVAEPQVGEVNAYGLSQTATVPWF